MAITVKIPRNQKIPHGNLSAAGSPGGATSGAGASARDFTRSLPRLLGIRQRARLPVPNRASEACGN